MASFQLKSFVAIVASMLNRIKATQTTLTDFNPGAIGRTILEAPAIEMEEVYQQAFNLVTAAIPVSVYKSFNFNALSARAASGTIRVTITLSSNPTVIPAGTQFPLPGSSIIYAASADATIAAGATYVDVQVAAITVGSNTNLAASTQFPATNPAISGFVSAVNLNAFANGRNQETPDEQQLRFNDYISTLTRGTVDAILYGLSTATVTDANGNVIEQVKLAYVDEPYTRDQTQPIALVNCYIHNGVGSTSTALQATAQKIINGYKNPDGTKVPGYKAAGVPCNVYLATEQALNVSGTLVLLANYDFATVEAACQSAVAAYLLSLGFSETALYSTIISTIKSVAGVYDFLPTTPTANTTAGIGVKIMPGAIAFANGGTGS